MIDAGSTTVRLSRLLPANLRMTVVTHAVPIAAQLARSPQIELHLLPGRVRRHTHAAVGPRPSRRSDQIRADLAFVGTNGITVRPRPLHPRPRRRPRSSARSSTGAQLVVVLADSSKIGLERTVRFAELSDIDILVTDDGDRRQ